VFKCRHSETWTWILKDFQAYLVGQDITFNATASDVGSDDLTFVWSFGDGSPDEATIHFNNGVSPDPYPSPEVSPMTATDTATHSYRPAGTYQVSLTVTDDDGGHSSVTFAIDVG
jgi:PKD repeat protein